MCAGRERKGRTLLSETDRRLLAVEVVKRRYELGHTIQKVARDLKIGTALATRLSNLAREEHLFSLQPTANTRSVVDEKLGYGLQKMFHLDQAVVVDCSGAYPRSDLNEADRDDYLHKFIATTSAAYVRTVLRDYDVIGVGGGRAVFLLAQALFNQRPLPQRDLTFVSLTGTQDTKGWGEYIWAELNYWSADADFVVRMLRESFELSQASALRLHSPLAYETSDARDAALEAKKNSTAARFPAAWPCCPPMVAIVGIGALNANHSFFRYHEGTELRPIESLLDRIMKLASQVRPFPVYDICNKLYYIEGLLQTDLENDIKKTINEINSRTISITIDELYETRKLIVIAGGKSKHDAIWGALRNRIAGDESAPLIDELYTDSETAEEMIRRGNTL